MKQFAVIGARGSLGTEVSEFLESQNVEVIRVVRENPNVNEVIFEEFLERSIQNCEVVFDFALLDIESMIRLRDCCELLNVVLVYMSSVVVKQESRWKDQYCTYKLSQYRVYRSYKRSIPYYGDLFVNEGGFLGYWKYLSVDGYFVSYRPLSITKTHDFLVMDSAKISSYALNNNSIPTYIIHRRLVDLIFKLKLNKLLSLIQINVVK